MFKSTLGKAVVILLVIIGFMQLTARMTVEKQIQENAVDAQQHYNQRLQQQKIEQQRMSDTLSAQRERHHRLTRLSRPLLSVKNTVMRYKRKHSEWPEDMTDLGLNSEKSADGQYTQSIKIDNGEIYAFLTEKYGANKIVRLYNTDGYTWKCSTNLLLEAKTTIADAPCSEESNISFNGRYIQ